MNRIITSCLLAAAALLWPATMKADKVTFRANVIDGRDKSDNQMWSTRNIGIYEFSNNKKKYAWEEGDDEPLLNAACYGNNGAICVGGYYYTFSGIEADTDEDPGNLEGDIYNTPMKVVARKWSTETWEKVDEQTFSTSCGLNFKDLTYDPNDDKVYCVYYIDGVDDLRFGTLDLSTYTVTPISQTSMTVEVIGLAAHPNGKIYAIVYSSLPTSTFLYEIDKHTGDITKIGDLGHGSQRKSQTATIDQRTGKMYWAGYMYYNYGNQSGKTREMVENAKRTGLYEIDVTTAACTLITEFPWSEHLTGLTVVGDIEAKAKDLHASATFPSQLQAGKEGTVTATVKNLGTEAAASFNVNLVLNGNVAATVTGTDLASGESRDFNLTFTPSVGLGKEAQVLVNVDFDGDQNTKNNSTEPFTIKLVHTTLPTVITLGMFEDGKVDLAWDAPVSKAITETFEDYAPFIISGIGDWTLVDRSGKQATVKMQDGMSGTYTYPNAGRPFAWQVFNPEQAGFDEWYWGADTCTYYCQSGSQMLMAALGAVPSAGGDGAEYVQGNEWLISPELSGKEQSISFYAKCWTSQVPYYNMYRHYPEMFRVLYSTTDTNPDSFTLLADTTEARQWFSDGAYQYTLPEGAKYFAIQRVTDPFVVDVEQTYTFGDDIQNGFFLFLDDITYTPATPTLKGYNVYKNGVKQNAEILTATEWQDANAQGEQNNVYTVSAVYEQGESAPSNAFTVIGTGINALPSTLNTQPSTTVYDLSGRSIKSAKLPRGIYVIGGRKVVVK